MGASLPETAQPGNQPPACAAPWLSSPGRPAAAVPCPPGLQEGCLQAQHESDTSCCGSIAQALPLLVAAMQAQVNQPPASVQQTAWI